MAKKSGAHYIGLAMDGGCPTRNGKGDHVVVKPPKGCELPPGTPTQMVIPWNLKGNGTEATIVKWLKIVGVLAILGVAVCKMMGG